uniref:Transposase (putative) gypsy type domain-containing protein n=1 Tax=Fagus sylvatica TaxID=28930 RepID=A0A2N9INU5_FAGSY
MPPTPYHRHGVTMCGVLNWSGGFQVISRVPREVETSFNEEASLQAASDTCHYANWSACSRRHFRQIFVFNEEASLQAASDTCHYATGRHVRGVVSSDFWRFFEYGGFLVGFLYRIWEVFCLIHTTNKTKTLWASVWVSSLFIFRSFFVGVSRFAENDLGPPLIEGFVSPDSVLHRLSAELYSVIYPSISTWEAIRGRMTANEAEWSLPLSEELPEGLSDDSAGREAREVSSEAIPSMSGSCQTPRVDRSWKALSFFSKIKQDDIDRIRRRYQIPDDVVLRIPDFDERACCPKYEGDVAFYEADLRASLRFPIQPFVRELLDFLSLAPGQVNPNGWRTIISCMVMWRVNSNGEEDLTVDDSFFVTSPVRLRFPGASGRLRTMMQTLGSSQDYPSSDRIWKDGYFFVCGDNWERLPQEDPRDFVRVRRSWGTPSSSALDRPLLNSVWQERILRILDIEDRRYNIFIEPDLLATFSLGPVPSSSVKALVKANKKRVDTMKLNKSRLKQLAQSGEVAIAPVSLKRKKPDEGSSRRTEEPPTRHTVRDAVPVVQTVPPVVMVDVDTAPPSNPSMATINQSPHVAMDRAKGSERGDEAMVMSQRCIAAEEGLATLRAKYMADEAEMKNAKRAVMELTRERKDALAEVEKLKKELKARIEGAKEAAVSEFRAFEVFEDINTRYFLSGFEAFRKQAVQCFLGLDFSALQPYDDEDSVVDASQDQAGDEDVSSK